MRAAVSLAAAVVILSGTGPARAEQVRVHGILDVAHAVGGYQDRELSFGAAGLVAIEVPFFRKLGGEVEVGTLLLAKGDNPKDPTLKPDDGANAIFGAVGIQARPFVTNDPTEIGPLTGIWASAHAGASTTGGLFRATVDLHGGYDLPIERGRYWLGPTVGLIHVFQSDAELRPEDANVFVIGVHGMFDSAPLLAPDRDGDGIIDRLDRCPDVPEDRDGFEDADGCPDLDNDKDGIPDAKDKCPDQPEDFDGFEDADGCPDLDNDKDGIPDAKDKCPNDPEDFDGFQDEDGCPDPDNDHDGIPDKEDLCPNEPETKNGYADEDGCPDEDQVRVVGEKIVLDDRVHFEQNNSIIREISFPLLERLSKLLRDHPEYVHIEVQGYTDQKGNAAFNEKLSADRATSVVEFLVRRGGIARGRLSAVGFGSSNPVVDKTTQHALFLNRRVEFVITRAVRAGAVSPAAQPAPDSSKPPAGTEERTP